MNTNTKYWLSLIGIGIMLLIIINGLLIAHDVEITKKRLTCLETGQVYNRVDDVEECIVYEPGA